MWNNFEKGHGKGEHDGARACVKTALRREELKLSIESTIRNAQSIVRWCTSVMGEESAMRVESTRKRHVERFFWEMVDIDHSHAWECKTVPGTRAFIRFEVLITQCLKFGPENSLVFARLTVMVSGMCVNHWIGLMDGIAYHFHLISVQLLS